MVAYSLFALGCFAFIVALICCVLGVIHQSLIPLVLGISLGFPAVMVLSLGKRMADVVFRIWEHGLEKRGVSGRQELTLGEIDVMLFDASRQRSYGRYVGTLYTLTFASRTDSGKSIFYTETTKTEDRQLLELRDRVAGEIARRMAQEFALTGIVRWTPELTLTSEGIDFRPQRVYGWGRKPVVLGYREIYDFDLEEHWFHLWSIAEERAVIKVSTASPNFYAGLILLEKLVENSPALRAAAHAGDRQIS
jgi:hypothetical protein